METFTEYAKSSDNFLAHRLWKQKILPQLKKDQSYPIAAVYLDLFEHFAISREFVNKMIASYVEAGFLEYDSKQKNDFVVLKTK